MKKSTFSIIFTVISNIIKKGGKSRDEDEDDEDDDDDADHDHDHD